MIRISIAAAALTVIAAATPSFAGDDCDRPSQTVYTPTTVTTVADGYGYGSGYGYRYGYRTRSYGGYRSYGSGYGYRRTY